MTERTGIDIVEELGGARVQHGALNDRVYLMDIGEAEPGELIPMLDELAETRRYSKIFAKVPAGVAERFEEAGYEVEARVPGYYLGDEDAAFMGRYPDEQRGRCIDGDALGSVLDVALSAGEAEPGPIQPPAMIRRCTEEDAPAMSRVFAEVFKTYPFPIFEPEFLRRAMDSDVAFFGVFVMGSPVAISSAEISRRYANAELTDFATLPVWRGNGFAPQLLRTMEDEIAGNGIKTAYTIARAAAPGINIVFSRAGYEYGGTLRNNTNISGRIESMNVWFKPLARAL